MALPWPLAEAVFGSRPIMDTVTWPGNPGAYETDPLDTVDVIPAFQSAVFKPSNAAAADANVYRIGAGFGEPRYVLHYFFGGTTPFTRNGGVNSQFLTFIVLTGVATGNVDRVAAVVPWLGTPVSWDCGTRTALMYHHGSIRIHERYLKLRLESTGTALTDFRAGAYLRVT